VEKVFHAAEYDIMCLKRDFGFEFARLFDTMVTARILGRQGVGLGALLEEEFNVHLNKRYQRANWGKRPLPAEMLSYARLDTHYLIALRERLASKLEKSGLEPLAHEDFERLATLEPHNSHNSPEEDTWRVSGSQDLHPQEAAVLLELCRYRDRVARQIDRPLFKVIGDKTLLAIAQTCPRSLNELKLIQGMSARQVGRHGRQLLEAVERGLRARPLHRPRQKRPDDGVLERVEALRNWRKKTARGMGVPSDVVLPRDLMYEIAYSDPAYKTDLQALLKDVPYRYKTFGEQILMTISKH
jgi:ribonuclease D